MKSSHSLSNSKFILLFLVATTMAEFCRASKEANVNTFNPHHHHHLFPRNRFPISHSSPFLSLTPPYSEEIDPRYGVEKRLVPTGPNPLHN
ncbi:hypothetical protein AMTRI_Chr10g225010 [Amborella trichopoda]